MIITDTIIAIYALVSMFYLTMTRRRENILIYLVVIGLNDNKPNGGATCQQ